MDWGKAIGMIAPTVATALGGPLAGLAVEAVGKAFGMSDPTIDKVQKAIQNGQLNADQLVALKNAEMALTTRMRELDIQEESLSYADTDSARKMQMATPSIIPPLLAVLIVAVVASAEGALLFGNLPKAVDPIILGRILGTMDAALMLVLNYYFGSSHSSARKDSMIATQLNQQP
jgi:hypothetical protein